MDINKSSGLIFHPTSLPSRYGIGDLGKESYEFVDLLSQSKTSIWQVLPLGITDDIEFSPYSSKSSILGNPYLVSLDNIKNKIFTSEELKRILREIPEFRKRTEQGWVDSKTSLLDKSRKFQSKEEKSDLNINDPRDIDHLSFGDKVQILDRKMYGKRFDGGKTELKPEQQEQNLLRYLRKIKSLRDNLAHHGKRKFQQQNDQIQL